MATLTSQEILAIVLVVVVSAIVAGLLLYLMRRLRERRAEILNQLDQSPRRLSDRAYNRLAMARREASLLSGQGVDVARAQEQVAQSQAAFDNRQFDRAYELAQSAHESLVRLRLGNPLRSTSTSGPAATPVTAPSAVTAPASAPVSPPLPAAVPKNRAESQFQLRLLDEALARAKSPDGARSVAIEAHGAFDAGNYTEAFRLALRARRQLGDGVEALAPTPGRVAGPVSDAPTRGGADPLGAAVAAASAERCAQCGHPTTADDVFCRGCGAPRTPTRCAQCGAPRTPADQFCGKCGASFR